MYSRLSDLGCLGFDEFEPFFDSINALIHSVQPIGKVRILLFEYAQASLDFAKLLRMTIQPGAEMFENDVICGHVA